MSLPEKISTTADIDVETSVIMLLFVHYLFAQSHAALYNSKKKINSRNTEMC